MARPQVGVQPRLLIALVALATVAAASISTVARYPATADSATHTSSGAAAPAHTLPLQFEQNQGQSDPAVRFLAREPGGTVFLTGNEMVFSLSGRTASTSARSSATAAGRAGHSPAPAVPATQAVVRMGLVGAAASPEIEGLDPQSTSRNYMVGPRSQWHLGVPSFGRVVYRNVYPGIDLVVHGETGSAEYDFVVAPGASPHAITLNFSGQRRLRLDGNGDLVLDTAAGPLTQHRPVIYQTIDGARHEVAGGFLLSGGSRLAFNVGSYDHRRPLIIDPVIAYSTFIGGSGSTGGDDVSSVRVDASGNAYLVGPTQSVDFPATTLIGPRNTNNAFILKLNPSGTAVVWATVFGGSSNGGDVAQAVAVDSSGNAWVTGFTSSTDFPTTANGFQPVRTCAQTPCHDSNAFVTEFNSTGTTLVYSTYLGGHGASVGTDMQSDQGIAIALDGSGKVYVAGPTQSPDFPTTTGAWETTSPGSFLTKFDPSLIGAASMVYSTFLGPTGVTSMTVDPAGEAVFTGWTSATNFPTTPGAYQTSNLSPPCCGDSGDGTLSKLNAAGSALLYSTYLGGSLATPIDSVALGPNGKLYVSGRTEASDFPTTAGAFSRTFQGGVQFNQPDDGFLSVIAPNGGGAADLVYSTYIGGSGNDDATRVAVDASGNAFLIAITDSSDWPLLNPIQGEWEGQNLAYGDNFDAAVAELRPSGAGASDLLFSTYLGGTADEQAVGLALGPQGTIYVAGTAYLPATPAGSLPVPFPTTRGALRETYSSTVSHGTGFATKLDLSGTTALLAVPGSNGSLWTKSDANPYQGLGGVLTAAPALVEVPGTSGALPTPLVIAVGSDHNLYVRSLTQGWQTLSSSPVYCIDTAGATVTTTTGATGSSTLTVACQGSDHGLWYAQGPVSAGSLPTIGNWQGLGGTLTAGPSVTTVAGTLTFMVVGGGGAVYSRTTSSGYTSTGWSCNGHVALSSYRGNAYFACQGSDKALWYSVNPGSGWVQVQSAGGTIADSPAIVATPAEVIVYVEGSNKAVYHVTLSPGGGPTTPWVYDGGSITFGPGATTLTP